MQIHSQSEFEPIPNQRSEPGLQKLLARLIVKIQRDDLIRQTTNRLRDTLDVNRVVLYYFYWQWQGQVTCESLSAEKFSILGSTGADNCFNAEYAKLYLAGRIRAITDIESEPIQDCHRDFLRSLQVRANLVAPILTPKGLWGLLVAHDCENPRAWSTSDMELMQVAAKTIAHDPNILAS